MRTTEPRRDPVREPTQTRSQQRVEDILAAAKQRIAEHGSGNLKMSHIATVAGISVSSIYQYFPNKSAVLAALCDQYLAQFREIVRDAFEQKPQTVTDLVNRSIWLLDGYYEFLRADPVWKDIWSAAGSDKNIEAVADIDTRQNAEVIFAQSKHLFRDTMHEEYAQKLFLIVTWGGKAADAAIDLPDEESARLLTRAKAMLMGCWREDIFPLARPELIGDLSGPLAEISRTRLHKPSDDASPMTQRKDPKPI